MKGNKAEEQTTMKDIKGFFELNDEELSQVSGGMVPKKGAPHKKTITHEKPTPEFVICPNCGETILPRKACPNCGYPDDE